MRWYEAANCSRISLSTSARLIAALLAAALAGCLQPVVRAPPPEKREPDIVLKGIAFRQYRGPDLVAQGSAESLEANIAGGWSFRLLNPKAHDGERYWVEADMASGSREVGDFIGQQVRGTLPSGASFVAPRATYFSTDSVVSFDAGVRVEKERMSLTAEEGRYSIDQELFEFEQVKTEIR